MNRTFLLLVFWRNRITAGYNGNVMSKRQILIMLGLWIMAFLFLGFPSGWDKAFALLSGLALIAVAYSLRPEGKQAPAEKIPYAEHRNQPVKPMPEAKHIQPAPPVRPAPTVGSEITSPNATSATD